MHETIKQMIQTFAKQRVLRRRAYAGFTALALLVSISTMYTLSKPAATLTGTPMCGKEEHRHTDECYMEVLVCGVENHHADGEAAAHEHSEACFEQQNVQICTMQEGEAHTHGDDCYGIACGEEEYEAHTHDESCYTTSDKQTCGEDEYDAHTHDDSCFETHAEQTCGESEYDAHSHDDSCYTTFTDTVCGESEYDAHSHDDGCYTTFSDKICGESEYDAHSHDDSCYSEVSKLTCSDSSEEHSHDDGCYTTETKLSCSSKEGAGHTHSDSCYQDRTELTCSAKEGAGHTHSDSCYQDRTELTCSAKEGAGHAHSDACYTDVTTQTCSAKEGPGHAHSESCYTAVTELTCTAKEGPGHTHSEACEGLTCGKEETEGHAHGDACFELQDVQICTADEELDDAGHTAACYEEVLICKKEVHFHNSTCYKPIDVNVPICGIDEHVHTGYCYKMELICGVDRHEDVHRHGEECYEEQNVLVCTLAETEPHTHEDACFGIACGVEESEGHTHSDDCYTVTTEQTCGMEEGEAHTHDETCVTETKTLTCTIEESEGHTHDESCIGLVCGKEETEGHAHGEDCYELQDVLICTTEAVDGAGHTDACFTKTLICELEEHTHTEACYPVQMMMVLPEGAEIPEGYDDVRTYTSPDGTFGVAVYAQPGAIPEDATLVAEILAEDSDEYAAAAESLDAMLAEEAEESEEVIEEEISEEIPEELIEEPAEEPVEEPVEEEPAEEPSEEPSEEPVDLGTESLIHNDPAEGEEPAEEPAEEPIEEEPAEEPAEEPVEEEPAEEPAEELVEEEPAEEPIEEPVEEETEEVTEEEIVEEEAEKPYDGLIAMDIRFEDARGNEVEPYEPVYVVINALGLLPEEADPASVSVQHHAEIEPISTFSLRRLLAPVEPEIVVTTVADATEDTGIVELAESRDEGVQDMLTAFAVDSFSTFTLTWNNNIATALEIICIDTTGMEIGTDTVRNISAETALNTAFAPAFTGYEYQYARVDSATADNPANSDRTAERVRYGANGWQYRRTGDWLDIGTDVLYLVYRRAATFQGVNPPHVTVNLFNYDAYSSSNTGFPGFYPGLNPNPNPASDPNINIDRDFTFKGGTSNNYKSDGWNTWTDDDNDNKSLGAYQGILQKMLELKEDPKDQFDFDYPKMALGTQKHSLDYLFEPGYDEPAREEYLQAQYLFQQDKDGYYYYDSSKNFAEFNTDTKEFLLYRDPASSGMKFAPFDTGLNDTSHEYHFGMHVETNFIMPQGGKVNGEDMIFSFNGDDDVWVFIDGMLILDIGGIHRPVGGSINFATGAVHVDRVNKGSNGGAIVKNNQNLASSYTTQNTTIRELVIAAYVQKYGEEDGKDLAEAWITEHMVQVGNNWIFKDYSEHNFQFYYLERGAGDSNGQIRFNLPTVPKNSLLIRKDLRSNSQNEELQEYLNTLDFKFRVLKAGAAATTANPEDLMVNQDFTYNVLDAETNATISENNPIGEDGIITIKPGQIAAIPNVASATSTQSYYVQELVDENFNGQYGGVQYNISGQGGSTNATSNSGVTIEGETFFGYNSAVMSPSAAQNSAQFTNVVDVAKLSVLTITKEAGPLTNLTGQTFNMRVTVGEKKNSDGTTTPIPFSGSYTLNGTSKTTTNGVITMAAGDKVSIVMMAGLPFSVEEVLSDDQDYTVSYKTVWKDSSNNEYTPTKDHTDHSGTIEKVNSSAAVTVTNSSFDMAAEIPVVKELVGYKSGSYTFNFNAVQVNADGSALTGTAAGAIQPLSITVNKAEDVTGSIYIGYKSDQKGVYYYKITETVGEYTDVSYDTGYYIVKVDATTTTPVATVVSHNGVASTVSAAKFVNTLSGDLAISKTVMLNGSVNNTGNFTFTLSSTGIGTESFEAYVGEEQVGDVQFTDGVANVTVAAGTTLTIKDLTIGTKITVTETNYDGYAPSWKVGADGAVNHSATAEATVAAEPVTIHFTNTTGAALPNTGGIGTSIFTFLGTMMMLSAGVLLMIQRRRREAT